MRQQLPVAAGGVGGAAPGALQEALVQQADDLRGGRGPVGLADVQALEVQVVVGARLRETGVGRLLEGTADIRGCSGACLDLV